MPWLINAAQLDKFRKNQKNVIIFSQIIFVKAGTDQCTDYGTNGDSGVRVLDGPGNRFGFKTVDFIQGCFWLRSPRIKPLSLRVPIVTGQV